MKKRKLIDATFTALPLGHIIPDGWLRNQLVIQSKGLTGHLEEHWEDVGPNSGWLGGDGDSWERGPYYLDGLVPLAYLLHDEHLIQKARTWIEWTMASQKKDGSFGPNHFTTVNTDTDFNVDMEQQDWWQDIIMLKVLTQYQEATDDTRIIPFMTKYFTYLKQAIIQFPLKEWAQARGADLLLSIHWLYEKTEDAMLLELADIVHEQTIDWTSIFSNFPYQRKQTEWDHRIHVVNVAMATKAPALFYRQTENKTDKEAIYKGIESLMTYHGQANGMFSGDEWLSGTHPSQGTELCAVVEYMYSMENLVRILGDGMFGDMLEKVTFNALPATISSGWDAHQYNQQVNQIMCNNAQRPWVNGPDANTFGLEPHFGCCTANMHQGWPKFAASLWMATQDNGLAAISYAPCHVKTVIENTDVELKVTSDYPFRDEVSIELNLLDEKHFPILLRIPGWCNNWEISINGEIQHVNVVDGFARLDRLWNNNDKIEIKFPMSVQIKKRNNNAVSIERGALIYALPIGEQWICTQEREKFHDWEIYPKESWQYGLQINSNLNVHLQKIANQPFSVDSPIVLTAKGTLLSNWVMEKNSAGSPPLNPMPYKNAQTKALTLVPYGCTNLRIAEFPILE